LLHRALSIFQGLGDQDKAAAALTSIGDIEWRQGEYSDALQSYRHAVGIYQQLGNLAKAATVTQDMEKVQSLIKGTPSPTP
jgi:hypothetical protein